MVNSQQIADANKWLSRNVKDDKKFQYLMRAFQQVRSRTDMIDWHIMLHNLNGIPEPTNHFTRL